MSYKKEPEEVMDENVDEKVPLHSDGQPEMTPHERCTQPKKKGHLFVQVDQISNEKAYTYSVYRRRCLFLTC
jgi:hypothetical protein